MSLDGDLVDISVLSSVQPQVQSKLTRLLLLVHRSLQQVLPGHSIVPYGSFCTGTMHRASVTIDMTVIGFSDESVAAAIAFEELQRIPCISVERTLPRVPHTQSAVCVHHHDWAVGATLSFHQTQLVRSTGMLSAAMHFIPQAAPMTIFLKDLARRHQLGCDVITSHVIAVSVVGFINAVRAGSLPLDSELVVSSEPTLAHLVHGYCSFFSSPEFVASPANFLIESDGVFRCSEPSSPTLWKVLDPVSRRNVAEHCIAIGRFQQVLADVDRDIRVRYTREGQRKPGAAHLLQICPGWTNADSSSSVGDAPGSFPVVSLEMPDDE